MTASGAAPLGFRTAIVERSFLDGVCSNWGCIPTKALLRLTVIVHDSSTPRTTGCRRTT
jgi:dihydrolipoamide dehydrogenase